MKKKKEMESTRMDRQTMMVTKKKEKSKKVKLLKNPNNLNKYTF